MKETLIKDIVTTVESFANIMKPTHLHSPNMLATIFHKVFDYKTAEIEEKIKIPKTVNVNTTAPVTVKTTKIETTKGEIKNG